MPRTCTVCHHEKREDIDAALLSGTAYRTVSDRFGPSKTALLRHREHLAPALAKAHGAAEVAKADNLLAKVQELEADVRRLGALAERDGDIRAALAATNERAKIAELLGRLRGEVDAAGRAIVTVETQPQATPEEVAQDLRELLSQLLRSLAYGALGVGTLPPEQERAALSLAAYVDGRLDSPLPEAPPMLPCLPPSTPSPEPEARYAPDPPLLKPGQHPFRN